VTSVCLPWHVLCSKIAELEWHVYSSHGVNACVWLPGEGLLPEGGSVAHRHLLHDRLRQWRQGAGPGTPSGPLRPGCSAAQHSALSIPGAAAMSCTGCKAEEFCTATLYTTAQSMPRSPAIELHRLWSACRGAVHCRFCIALHRLCPGAAAMSCTGC
jgi:hypothetical protein